jgi:hypothetical protein
MRRTLLLSIATISLPALLAGCSAETTKNAPASNETPPATNEVPPEANGATSASGNEAEPAGNVAAAAPETPAGRAILVRLERVATIPDQPNDQVNVSDVRFITGVAGPFITARVRYGGGCRPHEFKAYWNGSWFRSNPPGIAITLRHNANGDTCRMLFDRLVQIGISEPASANNRFWVQLTNVPGSAGRVDVTIP